MQRCVECRFYKDTNICVHPRSVWAELPDYSECQWNDAFEPLTNSATANTVEGANLHPPTPQGQHAEADTSAIA